MPEESQNGEVPDESSGEQAGGEESGEEKQPECGIVMPISRIGDLDPGHWEAVREILFESIKSAGFHPSLVSESADAAIIHKNIVQNLYENEIVVCDVSAKNPNVMFELGLRLAFDKPTVVVKDDDTKYSFDTSPIEHIPYPRSLRHPDVEKFKRKLRAKVKATYKLSQEEEGYSPFVGHFGTYKVSGLGKQEVTEFEYLRGEIDEVKEMLSGFKQRPPHPAFERRRERPITTPKVRDAIRNDVLPHIDDGVWEADGEELARAVTIQTTPMSADTVHLLKEHRFLDDEYHFTVVGAVVLRSIHLLL